MHTAYIALGSNAGYREEMLSTALQLTEERLGRIIALSQIYETKAKGYRGADYLNSAFELQTPLSPEELLLATQTIEQDMGRRNKTKTDENGRPLYEARCIDIDILYYEDRIVKQANLSIPHPRIHERRFVLQPLCDIAPEFIHPVINITNRQLLAALNS